MLEEKLGRRIPFGTLDINLYRDDWTTSSARPTIGESNITTPLDGKKVILVDDVLYTAGPSGQRWKPFWIMAVPVRWSCSFWWTAVIANCPFMETMWDAR